MTDGCYTEVEIISALATAAVDEGLRHLPPTLIAGYPIQPHSIVSGWSFLLFRGSGQTVQRSEVGVDRPPPPGRRPHFSFRFNRSRHSGLPLKTALATFTLITSAFGPAGKRPRLGNATGTMSGGGRCAIHKLGDTI